MARHWLNTCHKRKGQKQQQQLVERNQDEEKRDQDEDKSDTSAYAGVIAEGARAKTIEMLDEEVMATEKMTPGTDGDRKGEQPSRSQFQQRVKWDYRKVLT